MFDRVFVINLDRRPDRWEAFLKRFPADWPWRQPERVSACDGKACEVPEWYKAPVGAWGCHQSHVRLWWEQLENEWESVLILEDDAVFARQAVPLMQETLSLVPDDWDQLYFGGQHLKTNEDETPPEVAIQDKLCRCRYVNRTHAYAMRLPFAEAALESIDCQSPADDGKLHHIDYRLGEMHATGRWNIYAPWRFCVGQAGGESDVRNGRRGGQHVREHFWNCFPIEEPAGVM